MKTRSQFVCQQCGYSQSQWAGKCPSCETGNAMVETVLNETQNSKGKSQNYNSKVLKLSDIKTAEGKRMKTGEAELDSVLG